MNAPAKFPRTTTMSAREFNQNTSSAKKAADDGPVIITDRGKPAYVLMSNAEYERIKAPRVPLLSALEQKGGPEYDFEIELPRRRVETMRDPFAE